MESVFPFGIPGPTLLYLMLYVLTLAVHFVFMNYVFAGTSDPLTANIVGAGFDDREVSLICCGNAQRLFLKGSGS